MIDNCIINFNKMEQELCHIEKRITLNCFKKYFYQALDLIGKKNFPETYQNTKLAKIFATIKKIQDAYLGGVKESDLVITLLTHSKNSPISKSSLEISDILNSNLDALEHMSLSEVNRYHDGLNALIDSFEEKISLFYQSIKFENLAPEIAKNIFNNRVANSPDKDTESALYFFLERLCSENPKLSSNLIFAYFDELDATVITNLVEIYYHNRVFYDTRHASEKQIFNSGLFETLPNEIKLYIAHFVIENFAKSLIDSCAKNQQINKSYNSGYDANNFNWALDSDKSTVPSVYRTLSNTSDEISQLGDILLGS